MFVTTYVYEMTWSTWSYESGDADLTSAQRRRLHDRDREAVVRGGASFDDAVTVFASLPLPAVGEPFASSSACVNVCVAVQVIDAAGASSSPGSSPRVALSSASAIPVSVTLPVFVTRYE